MTPSSRDRARPSAGSEAGSPRAHRTLRFWGCTRPRLELVGGQRPSWTVALFSARPQEQPCHSSQCALTHRAGSGHAAALLGETDGTGGRGGASHVLSLRLSPGRRPVCRAGEIIGQQDPQGLGPITLIQHRRPLHTGLATCSPRSHMNHIRRDQKAGQHWFAKKMSKKCSLLVRSGNVGRGGRGCGTGIRPRLRARLPASVRLAACTPTEYWAHAQVCTCAYMCACAPVCACVCGNSR